MVDIVTSAVEAIRPALEAAGQPVARRPGLRQPMRAGWGRCCSNLLEQPTEYTPRGAVSLHVATEGGNVITAISDSGRASAEALDRIVPVRAGGR